jgi:hypothetical protein
VPPAEAEEAGHAAAGLHMGVDDECGQHWNGPTRADSAVQPTAVWVVTEYCTE